MEGKAPECQEQGNEAWLKLSKKSQVRKMSEAVGGCRRSAQPPGRWGRGQAGCLMPPLQPSAEFSAAELGEDSRL